MEPGDSWTLSDPGDRQTRVDLARILCPMDCFEEKLENDRWIINLDPKLSEDERQIIVADYHGAISQKRHAIRVLESVCEQERALNRPDRAQKLEENRAEAILQLDSIVSEFLRLLDDVLIPEALGDDRATIFYIKTKADFLRYSCEWTDGEERQSRAQDAEKCYKRATELFQLKIGTPDALSFAIGLNYSIFLFETVKRREAAVEVAQQTLDECLSVLKDSEESPETAHIHQVLRANIRSWTSEDEM